MATYIAKQVVGKKLESVKGALADDRCEKTASEAEEPPPPSAAEMLEERREAEKRRKERFMSRQEDREKLRQDIRDKYGLKKKDEEESRLSPSLLSESRAGSISSRASFSVGEGRAHGSTFTRGVDELTTRVTQMPGKVLSSVSGSNEKCALQ